MSYLAPTEIQALARIMDELDYYQLMHVKRGANVREVKAAYYSTSRAFHPDANHYLAPELREAVATITKRESGSDPWQWRLAVAVAAVASGRAKRLKDAKVATDDALTGWQP